MCTSMSKGMGLCLCIAHAYLDMIVSSFGFYMHEYECMNMCHLSVLCKRIAHIYVYIHMNDDIVNKEALKVVLKFILN